MQNQDYIKKLNDDDTLLIKTSLLIYIYSYYEDNNLLDTNLREIFDKIITKIRINKTRPNIIEPPYFKISFKDIKTIFAKAPYDIYSNALFKEEQVNNVKH